MPRAVFEKEIQRLQAEMLVLGRTVGEALIDSVAVLGRRDTIGAQRLVAQDRRINQRRFDIEGDALALIATQQPTAVGCSQPGTRRRLSVEYLRAGGVHGHRAVSGTGRNLGAALYGATSENPCTGPCRADPSLTAAPYLLQSGLVLTILHL